MKWSSPAKTESGCLQYSSLFLNIVKHKRCGSTLVGSSYLQLFVESILECFGFAFFNAYVSHHLLNQSNSKAQVKTQNQSRLEPDVKRKFSAISQPLKLLPYFSALIFL